MAALMPPSTEDADRPAAPPRRPRASRLSSGHLLIALAAIVAVVANYAVLRARDDTVRVAVIAAEVPAGATVEASALGVAELRADEALLATLVRHGEVASVEGQVAVSTLRPGDLLRRSDLQPPAAGDGLRAMSVPVAPEHAAGGRLRAGDRVDVVEVRDGRAAYLATDVQVLEAADVEARPGITSLRSYSVTLAVDDETALRLALALRTATLDLVRSTGAAAVGVDGVELP